MIEGISVAITTYNALEHLKKCLYSIQKYSALPKTDVSIFVDGSTDGTFEWLQKEKIPHIGRKNNKGCFSGWNRAIKNCRNEYFILGEDDEFYGPDWDFKVAQWIEELGENYIVMPQIVEPTYGCYPPIYDCGKTPQEFDEEKFVAYARTHANHHELIADPNGFWTMKKSLFFSIGGYDDIYDPIYIGTVDLHLRLTKAYPNLRWIRVWNSMIYHFPVKLNRKRFTDPKIKQSYSEINKSNVKRFTERYKMTINEAYKSVPVGLK